MRLRQRWTIVLITPWLPLSNPTAHSDLSGFSSLQPNEDRISAFSWDFVSTSLGQTENFRQLHHRCLFTNCRRHNSIPYPALAGRAEHEVTFTGDRWAVSDIILQLIIELLKRQWPLNSLSAPRWGFSIDLNALPTFSAMSEFGPISPTRTKIKLLFVPREDSSRGESPLLLV